MIAFLRGVVLSSEMGSVILDVQGVGYDVAIPLSTFDRLPRPGEKAELLIYTQVREDAIVLFGFATPEEKELFKILLNVSGIGGKLALSVLSAMPVENFCSAVKSGNLAMLGKISGVGKRTAERLVVELKGKLDGFSMATLSSSSRHFGAVFDDVLLALTQLGFKRDQSADCLAMLLENAEEEYNSETLLRKALLKIRN